MPPKKRTKYTNLPKYVTVVNGIYVQYRPKIEASKRHLFETNKQGFVKAIPLGKTTDSEDSIMRAYLAAKSQLEPPNKGTLNQVSEKYQQSRQFKALSFSVQKNYINAAKILGHELKINGEDSTLGKVLASQITKPVIQSIMEKRLIEMQDKGFSGKSVINHQVAYVSSMLSWASNFMPESNIKSNPLRGLQKFSENKRERYVHDSEYLNQYKAVIDHQYLPEFFEIAYLCACRSIEVRDLNLSDILDNGLRVRRRKGSKDNIIEWNPRLKEAVKKAKEKRVKAKVLRINEEQPLLTDRNGERISKTALNSAMQRLRKKVGENFWSLHLLKHKGMTDAENKNIGGHVTEQMKNRYDHSLPVIKPPTR